MWKQKLRVATTVVTLLTSGIVLGGCSQYVQAALDTANNVVRVVTDGVKTAADVVTGVRVGLQVALPIVQTEFQRLCTAVGSPTEPGLPQQCTAKISSLKAGWRSACANAPLLSNEVAGDYVKKIKSDIKAVQTACPQ
jgi:hypothetical protein